MISKATARAIVQALDAGIEALRKDGYSETAARAFDVFIQGVSDELERIRD